MPVHQTDMLRLKEKLSRLKQHLHHWNKDIFGNIFQHLKDAEPKVEQAERRYDADPTESNLIEMYQVTALLQHVLTLEEDYWRQMFSFLGEKEACSYNHQVNRA
ncbi:UNVERIFIED_CONTAM: hypothetical protein Sradi_3177600 [Sesamum radiatum]|uniref:Uncharacterized protein n=1 Tax=Sesamum radiatum TaxID=300843 RepID=A0AAW2RGK4_SESRA